MRYMYTSTLVCYGERRKMSGVLCTFVQYNVHKEHFTERHIDDDNDDQTYDNETCIHYAIWLDVIIRSKNTFQYEFHFEFTTKRKIMRMETSKQWRPNTTNIPCAVHVSPPQCEPICHHVDLLMSTFSENCASHRATHRWI